MWSNVAALSRGREPVTRCKQVFYNAYREKNFRQRYRARGSIDSHLVVSREGKGDREDEKVDEQRSGSQDSLHLKSDC